MRSCAACRLPVLRLITPAAPSWHGAALGTEHFDLAVVDIGLPGADGLSLVKHVRGEGRTTPILILTARFTLADKVRAFELGADDFLMKPFEQAELAGALPRTHSSSQSSSRRCDSIGTRCRSISTDTSS